MIIVQKTFTADNTDLLSGTDLANIPGAGQLDIYIVSTQLDTVISITGPGSEPILRLQQLTQRTNGQPILSDDVPYSVPVIQGGKYILNLDVVTAATVGLIAIYRDLLDLQAG